ncbi:MAG: ACP S-malonyltransferase [Desulfobacteraceae bacterium]|nr:ACP S-malonyltransferase [Desulfobacteraceae bacterium]
MKNNTAYLYPGQSPQPVGIALDLYGKQPRVRRIFMAADEFLGFPLSRICFEGSKERLNEDLICQLAVYTVSCALTDLLVERGVQPVRLTGYSSGFYAAAYAAGCFDFITGLGIVRKAGELLLDTGKHQNGGMAVIFGLSADEIQAICNDIGGIEPVIYNTPRQTIISGAAPQLESAIGKAMAQGALDAYRLPAAIAYHSVYMEPAAKAFLAEIDLNKLKPARCPLISYSTLHPVNSPKQLAESMAMQLSSPVRWVELIQSFSAAGIRYGFEIGPGQVITRSIRWIDRRLIITPIGDMESLNTLDMSLNNLSAYNGKNQSRTES